MKIAIKGQVIGFQRCLMQNFYIWLLKIKEWLTSCFFRPRLPYFKFTRGNGIPVDVLKAGNKRLPISIAIRRRSSLYHVKRERFPLRIKEAEMWPPRRPLEIMKPVKRLNMGALFPRAECDRNSTNRKTGDTENTNEKFMSPIKWLTFKTAENLPLNQFWYLQKHVRRERKQKQKTELKSSRTVKTRLIWEKSWSTSSAWHSRQDLMWHETRRSIRSWRDDGLPVNRSVHNKSHAFMTAFVGYPRAEVSDYPDS